MDNLKNELEYKYIKEKALEILKELGDCYIEELKEKDKYTYYFKGFGLKIKSSVLCEKGENYDKEYIKSQIDVITIEYCDNCSYSKYDHVYYTAGQYYKSGVWEIVFNELYNKLINLKKIIEKRNYIIEYIKNDERLEKLKKELEDKQICITKSDCSSFDEYLNKNYMIYKDGINVLEINADEKYQKTIVFEYGNWLDIIYNSIKIIEDNKTKEQQANAKVYLKQLHDLK